MTSVRASGNTLLCSASRQPQLLVLALTDIKTWLREQNYLVSKVLRNALALVSLQFICDKQTSVLLLFPTMFGNPCRNLFLKIVYQLRLEIKSQIMNLALKEKQLVHLCTYASFQYILALLRYSQETLLTIPQNVVLQNRCGHWVG